MLQLIPANVSSDENGKMVAAKKDIVNRDK